MPAPRPWPTEVRVFSRINTISSWFSPRSSPPLVSLENLSSSSIPNLAGHDTVLAGIQIVYQHLIFIPGLDQANLLIETLPRATLDHEPVHSRSTANDGALV